MGRRRRSGAASIYSTDGFNERVCSHQIKNVRARQLIAGLARTLARRNRTNLAATDAAATPRLARVYLKMFSSFKSAISKIEPAIAISHPTMTFPAAKPR